MAGHEGDPGTTEEEHRALFDDGASAFNDPERESEYCTALIKQRYFEMLIANPLPKATAKEKAS